MPFLAHNVPSEQSRVLALAAQPRLGPEREDNNYQHFTAIIVVLSELDIGSFDLSVAYGKYQTDHPI